MSKVERRYYTVGEVVDMGVMSRSTIWRQIQAGNLEALQVGSALRIPVDGLERFIEAHTINRDPRGRKLGTKVKTNA
ncbi:MAG: helix-turn-helix domain-containing protein [Atopobiaceae bacterium]|nr:helix-turn-helix domain-containing protein [Atopobiaceae bacterium]